MTGVVDMSWREALWARTGELADNAAKLHAKAAEIEAQAAQLDAIVERLRKLAAEAKAWEWATDRWIVRWGAAVALVQDGAIVADLELERAQRLLVGVEGKVLAGGEGLALQPPTGDMVSISAAELPLFVAALREAVGAGTAV